MKSFFSVASAVAWRGIHNFATNPALIVPSLLFPLFFLAAFAGGLSRVSNVPNFDYKAGYTAFQYVWVLLQTVAVGGAFTGFAVARDFEGGFAQRLLLAAPRRGGIILGYICVALVRVTFTGGVVTVAALLAGMNVLGSGVDILGLVGLAALVNVAATLFAVGMALLLRTSQGGFLIQTPIFVATFLAPVFVPLKLLNNWIETVAYFNPVTYILETGRGFLAGNPSGVLLAFGFAVALIIILVPWVLFGLRSAEKAG